MAARPLTRERLIELRDRAEDLMIADLMFGDHSVGGRLGVETFAEVHMHMAPEFLATARELWGAGLGRNVVGTGDDDAALFAVGLAFISGLMVGMLDHEEPE